MAESRLSESIEEEMFGSILALVNDEAQNIEGKIYERMRSKDED
jgi:hypothetical protein